MLAALRFLRLGPELRGCCYEPRSARSASRSLSEAHTHISGTPLATEYPLLSGLLSRKLLRAGHKSTAGWSAINPPSFRILAFQASDANTYNRIAISTFSLRSADRPEAEEVR